MNETKGTRKRRTLNRSYIAEARDDIDNAVAEIHFAEAHDSVHAVQRAMKDLDLAERRLRETVEHAVAPEGQAVLDEEHDLDEGWEEEEVDREYYQPGGI